MAQKLEQDLSRHSFETQTTMAPTLSDAILGVVACHGMVGHFGQFIAVAPDRTRLFTTGEFASQFESLGCLVLLICSAGRGDERTHTSETRSLVSLLLERGVRTIIAPVWPLNTDVATVWLPQFLDHVTSGSPVGIAAFEASRAVREVSG